jgi:UDP-glucuronate 4-epimerase
LSKTVLVTGVAGFIGSHVAQHLLERGDTVIGIDNLNDYYDVARKYANLEEIRAAIPDESKFIFLKGDLRDKEFIAQVFQDYSFDAISHLAAMAGVRVSIDDPQLYYDVNVTGTLNLLEGAVGRIGQKNEKSPNFVFATTSSAYGNTTVVPFVESDPCNAPLAPYASSKRGAELLGYTYHYLYQLNFTALRFFNVYGPRGRPDMMAFKLLDSIYNGTPVPLYNGGDMHRDWTYVYDIASGVIAALDRALGYEVINIGRGKPIHLASFVEIIEGLAGKKANLIPAPMMDADVKYTYADISKAEALLGYNPKTHVEEGCQLFFDWYHEAILNKAASGQAE